MPGHPPGTVLPDRVWSWHCGVWLERGRIFPLVSGRLLPVRGRVLHGAHPCRPGPRRQVAGDHGPAGTRHHLNYLLFRVFRIAILVVCVVRALEPGLDPWLVPIRPLWQPWLIVAGNVLLAG